MMITDMTGMQRKLSDRIRFQVGPVEMEVSNVKNIFYKIDYQL